MSKIYGVVSILRSNVARERKWNHCYQHGEVETKQQQRKDFKTTWVFLFDDKYVVMTLLQIHLSPSHSRING